jgi:hypothetical protein
MANLCPIQLRLPAENGIYAYGSRSSEFSGRKRSGKNFSGFTNCFGSRWIRYEQIFSVTPLKVNLKIQPETLNFTNTKLMIIFTQIATSFHKTILKVFFIKIIFKQLKNLEQKQNMP